MLPILSTRNSICIVYMYIYVCTVHTRVFGVGLARAAYTREREPITSVFRLRFEVVCVVSVGEEGFEDLFVPYKILVLVKL